MIPDWSGRQSHIIWRKMRQRGIAVRIDADDFYCTICAKHYQKKNHFSRTHLDMVEEEICSLQ